ncbi:nicastrin-like isoform X2 [Oculina patagonica]
MLNPLIENNKISGALIIAVPSGKHRYTPQKGSPDYTCPNDNFGAYSKDSNYTHCKALKWNKDGSGMSFNYYDIPMFALDDENEVDALIKCYRDYNSQRNPDYPLCAVQLKDFMYAAKNTPTCIRKTNMPNPIGSEFCQPLGDTNVWGTLYPIKKNRKVVMLATKLDSSSFFHDLAPGVENDGTGIIVALAAAKALGAAKRNGSISETKNHIMFTFFQGESWDYIGSSRMVYDMDYGKFPEKPWKVDDKTITWNTNDIKYFLELNQVGLVQDDPQLWAHSDPVSRMKSTENEVKKMFKILKESGNKFKVDIKEPAQQPLPPASFQRFLRSNNNIPGIVLTDHKQEYKNKFYNSHFDDLYQVGGNYSKENDTVYLITEFTKKLAKISSTVATALYTLANDGDPPKDDIKADDALIGHLVYCLFNRSNCPLYREVSDSNKTWDSFSKSSNSLKPFPRYISVNGTSNPLTATIYYLLLYFTGYHFPSSDKCQPSEGVATAQILGKDLQGTCVKGSVFQSPAVSPAFVLKQYDSTEYSTWAESTWGNDLTVRVFLVASPQLEGVTLGAGLIITLVSFVLVYFINKKADLIFTPTDPLSSDLDG